MKMDNKKLGLLNQIKYFYGLNSSKSIDLLNDYFKIDPIDEDPDPIVAALQQNLVDAILKDPHLDRFIGSRKFRQSFLKTVITIVERLNVEVNQEIYEKLLTLINESQCDEERSFLLFYDRSDEDSLIIDSSPIIVEQSRAIIANGTTGLHVWPACFQLINYLDRNRHLINQK